MDLPITPDQVVEQKLKPQIEAQGLTEEEAKEYVKDYMEEAGEQFKEAIQAQVDQMKEKFGQIVQSLADLLTTIAAIPAIMANPMTVAVANQTLQETIGGIKGVQSSINEFTSAITQMIGSAPGVLGTLASSATGAMASAKESLVVAQPTTGSNNQQVGNEQTSLQVIWEAVEPGKRISIFWEGEEPSWLTINTSSNTIITITVPNQALVLEGESFNYTVEATYQEEDGMDGEGNVQYVISTKEYTGRIYK